MKLFSDRAIDYFRDASPDDRRYLLFNPITKMKVTTEGERVIDHLWTWLRARALRKNPSSRLPRATFGRLRKSRAPGTLTWRLACNSWRTSRSTPASTDPVP